MVELDQFKYTINQYRDPLVEVGHSLDLERKKDRIEELEADMESPGFWDNIERSQQVMKELKNLKDTVEEYKGLVDQLEDIDTKN